MEKAAKEGSSLAAFLCKLSINFVLGLATICIEIDVNCIVLLSSITTLYSIAK